jgi:hypothetical protein
MRFCTVFNHKAISQTTSFYKNRVGRVGVGFFSKMGETTAGRGKGWGNRGKEGRGGR